MGHWEDYGSVRLSNDKSGVCLAQTVCRSPREEPHFLGNIFRTCQIYLEPQQPYESAEFAKGVFFVFFPGFAVVRVSVLLCFGRQAFKDGDMDEFFKGRAVVEEARSTGYFGFGSKETTGILQLVFIFLASSDF